MAECLSISIRNVVKVANKLNTFACQLYFKDLGKIKLLGKGDSIVDQNGSLFSIVKLPNRIVNGSTVEVEGVNFPLESPIYGANLYLGGIEVPAQRTIIGVLKSVTLIKMDADSPVLKAEVDFSSSASEDVGLLTAGSIFNIEGKLPYVLIEAMELKGFYKIKPLSKNTVFDVGSAKKVFVDVEEPFSVETPKMDCIPEIFISSVNSLNPDKPVLCEFEENTPRAIVRRFKTGSDSLVVGVCWSDKFGLKFRETDIRVNGHPIENIKALDGGHYQGFVKVPEFSSGELVARLGTGEKHSINGEVIQVVPKITKSGFLGLGFGQSLVKVGDVVSLQVTTDSDLPLKADIQSSEFSLINEVYTPVNGVVNLRLVSLYSKEELNQVNLKFKVNNALGFSSDWTLTETPIKLGNPPPKVSVKEIIYPKNQRAIKGTFDLSEFAFISLNVENATHLRFRHLNPESTRCEFDEEGFVTFEACKQGESIGARIFVDPSWEENCLFEDNIEIIAYNSHINKESRCLAAVNVANLPLDAKLFGTEMSLISGGNNNTQPQVHTLSLEVNQPLLVDPELNVDLKLKPSFSKNESLENTWQLALTVHDDDKKGIVFLNDFKIVNLAGKVLKSPSNTNTLMISGFCKRFFKMDAYPYRYSSDRLNVDISKVENLKASHFGMGKDLSVNIVNDKLHDDSSITLVDATTGKPKFKRGSRIHNNDLTSAVGNTTGNLTISLEELPFKYSYLDYMQSKSND